MSWQTLGQKQPNVTKILGGSLAKGRIAHAYLFAGGQETGKKEAATLFAKRYFCGQAEGVEPCGVCRDCKRIDSGNHPDVHVVAPDGASIKKGQVTDLIHEFSYEGMESSRKVYIIEHVDKMTIRAANSLLKFLEEPGDMTVAILLTEQLQRMLDTIRSRCQILTFHPLPPATIEGQITESAAPEAVRKTAARLTSDRGKAQALADDAWFAQARTLVIQLTKMLEEPTHHVFLFLQKQWFDHFENQEQWSYGLDLLLLWYRDILHIQTAAVDDMAYADERDTLAAWARKMTVPETSARMSAILDAERRLGANVGGQLVYEQLVLKLQEGSHGLQCDRHPFQAGGENLLF